MYRKVNLYVLSFLFVVFAQDCFSQSLIFPVFVNAPTTPGCTTECRSWMSHASVLNPNDTENTVTFTSYDSNGNIIRSSGPQSVPAFSKLDSSGLPGSGWLKITATKPLIGRETITLLELLSPPEPFGLVRGRLNLAPASISRRHVLNIDSIAPLGVSIVYPSDQGNSPARGKLIHRGGDGKTVSEKEIVIAPNGQLIGFLEDLLPPESAERLTRGALGSVEIQFDQEVAVTILQFWRPTGLIEQEIEEATVSAVAGAR